MNADQISQAKDKDLPASLIAIRRAALDAREIAMRTGTAIIVQRDQQMIRITAEELREAAGSEKIDTVRLPPSTAA